MKSSKGLIIIILVFVVLIALNFFFFVDTRGANETEQNGNRSSYLASPYGTLAYYKLLEQMKLPVTRLTRSFTALDSSPNIRTLIVIAPPIANNPTKEELNSLNRWIESGGLLIVIDRRIFLDLGKDVHISTALSDGGTVAKPLQPAPYTQGAHWVQLTSFASRINIKSPSAVDYIGDGEGAILADSSVGKGKVVCLSEPFIVANNGISKADNLAVALDILSERPSGQIAFDEYHHGYGSEGVTSGGFLGYFHGTPVPWLLAQAALIGLLIIYNQGRRFGRAIPIRREKRTTNLEFVSSMATITRLAQATDLAMQNIYWEFHRRLCQYCGLPSNTAAARLAAAASRRSGIPEDKLMDILVRCAQIASGRRVSDSEMLTLVNRIREIETTLKL